MSNALKTRVQKLHKGAISDVNSEILITRGDEVLRKSLRGTNPAKVIRIVVRL